MYLPFVAREENERADHGRTIRHLDEFNILMLFTLILILLSFRSIE